jgi:AraC-like DNA-binding protein
MPLERGTGWWFYGGNLTIGSIITTAWTAMPMRLLFSENQQLITLVGYGGTQRIRQASRTWGCTDDSCLLMASESCSLETSLSSAVAFALSQERLLHTAMTMAGVNQKPTGWHQLLESAHGWTKPADPAAPCLQEGLRQVIATAGQLSGFGTGLLERLNLDDQIYRLMAAMLIPELRQGDSLDRLIQRQRQGRDAFDELIDYIQKNLSEPLTLSHLESKSHYSRRALQYAFTERMGCSITQWIKSQRLDRARRRLENPGPTDTVSSISLECGYRSLGLFSVDFQQRFHVKPSQLLRESRAASSGAVVGVSAPHPDD